MSKNRFWARVEKFCVQIDFWFWIDMLMQTSNFIKRSSILYSTVVWKGYNKSVVIKFCETAKSICNTLVVYRISYSAKIILMRCSKNIFHNTAFHEEHEMFRYIKRMLSKYLWVKLIFIVLIITTLILRSWIFLFVEII